MDRITSSTVAFNTQQGAHPQVAAPAQTIEALVLQLLDTSTVRISVAGTIIDLPTQIPLIPGSFVRLAVRGHGTDSKFVIVGPSPRTPVDLSQRPLDHVTISNAAVVTSAATGSGLPAGGAVVAHAPTAPHGAPAQGTVAAGVGPVVDDGVVATPAAIVDPQLAQSKVAADPKQATQEPAVALAVAMRTAAARQLSLSPLLADAAEAMTLTHLPTPVRQALLTLMAFPPSFEEGVTPGVVRQSVKHSGIFLEARLADLRVPFTPAPDLKVALLALRHTLHDWAARAQRYGETTSALAHALAALSVPKPDGEHAAASAAAAASEAPANLKPPPPYPGAPTTGQPPAAPSVDPHTPLDVIRERLIERTEGALARMTLLQSASLPDAINPHQARSESPAPHWSFEIPFVVPQQGAAVAQFEIARDGCNGSPQERKAPVWRANFSIDIEPIGPVHAQVAVSGNRAAVRLWAERTASAAALRAGAPELTQALQSVALDTAEILVRNGVPPRPVKAPAGRFVDRAS